MRAIVVALLIAVAVSADPIPCISLNGRAYVPMSVVGISQVPPECRRSMCGTDFVWVHTVAEAHGANVQWRGRQVELVDWRGNVLYSFLPLPPREFWRSKEARDAYPVLIAAADGRVAPHVKPHRHDQVNMAWAQPSRGAGVGYSGAIGQALAAERTRLQYRDAIGLGGLSARIESRNREMLIIGAYADEQAWRETQLRYGR
jgi:hypothetical protein